jgi:hypothetical protein
VSRYEAIVCVLAWRCCMSEEALQQGSEGGLCVHDGCPQRRSSRAIACAMSSGQPLRYQYVPSTYTWPR